MMNKKKRQSEREAEIAQRNQQTWGARDEAEVDSTSRHMSSQLDPSDNEAKSANELESKSQCKLAETGKEKLDLNTHPSREEDSQAASNRVSMMSLLQVASRPLDTYLKQNGLTSLMQDQQQSVPQVTSESEEQINEDQGVASDVQERESGGEEQCGTTDQNQSEPHD